MTEMESESRFVTYARLPSRVMAMREIETSVTVPVADRVCQCGTRRLRSSPCGI